MNGIDETGLCRNLVVGGISYPQAIVFERRSTKNARYPVGYERDERTGDPLYVTPGGGRATAAEIMAGGA